MKVTIAWWELDGSTQTIDSLREYLRDEGVEPWHTVPGLCLKLWIADRGTDRWGAVMLWESAEAGQGPLPPNKATDLIGYPPTHRAAFDVEASVEGVHALTTLSGFGPALETIRSDA